MQNLWKSDMPSIGQRNAIEIAGQRNPKEMAMQLLEIAQGPPKKSLLTAGSESQGKSYLTLRNAAQSPKGMPANGPNAKANAMLMPKNF